jgi:hypothetical protein
MTPTSPHTANCAPSCPSCPTEVANSTCLDFLSHPATGRSAPRTADAFRSGRLDRHVSATSDGAIVDRPQGDCSSEIRVANYLCATADERRI